MEKILGLIDTLESIICDSPKIPLTGKTLINEADLLAVIDKIRLVIQSGDDFIKTKSPKTDHEISLMPKSPEAIETAKPAQTSDDPEARAMQVIQQAYQVAKEIRSGADSYADEVLANLEATTNRILRTVKNGRVRLTKSGGADTSIPDLKGLSSFVEDDKNLSLSAESEKIKTAQ